MKPSPKNLIRVSLALLLGVAGLILCVLPLAYTSATHAETPIDHASKGWFVTDENLSEASSRQDTLTSNVRVVLPESQRPRRREGRDGGSQTPGARPPSPGDLR